MTLFLPVRDPLPAVVVSWIAFFHLFTSSCGTHDSICGVLNIWRDIKPPDRSLWPFKFFCNQFQFFWIHFFLALPGLSSIRFLFPAVPLDLFRFCESCVSRMHSTWWDHTLLLASHPAVPIEKWRARGRVQMPRPLLGGGGKRGRGSTLRHGAACLPRRGAPVLCLHLKSPQDGPPHQSMHAAVGITHISWGGCVGKARTWHDSGRKNCKKKLVLDCDHSNIPYNLLSLQ